MEQNGQKRAKSHVDVDIPTVIEGLDKIEGFSWKNVKTLKALDEIESESNAKITEATEKAYLGTTIILNC